MFRGFPFRLRTARHMELLRSVRYSRDHPFVLCSVIQVLVLGALQIAVAVRQDRLTSAARLLFTNDVFASERDSSESLVFAIPTLHLAYQVINDRANREGKDQDCGNRLR